MSGRNRGLLLMALILGVGCCWGLRRTRRLSTVPATTLRRTCAWGPARALLAWAELSSAWRTMRPRHIESGRPGLDQRLGSDRDVLGRNGRRPVVQLCRLLPQWQ